MNEDLEQQKTESEPQGNNQSLILSFEERIERLVHRGQKRGKRYSVIGIVSSVVIAAIFISFGYYLFTEIVGFTNRVDKQEQSDNFQGLIDPDNRCKGEGCCLASVERMRRNKYVEIGPTLKCEDGFKLNSLKCENSLKWCEKDASSTVPQVLIASSSDQDLSSSTLMKDDNKQIDNFQKTDSEKIDLATSSKNNQEASIVSSSTMETGSLKEDSDSQMKDTDGDGLNDLDEKKYGTKINIPDTDGDGYTDGEEVKKGYNPLGK